MNIIDLYAYAAEFEKLAGKKQVGTIYLIHFKDKIGDRNNIRSQAQHYIGWTSDLPSRLNAHSLGQGSAIMRHVVNSGIPYKVVKTWVGTRDQERALKNQKNSKRYCSICSSTPY